MPKETLVDVLENGAVYLGPRVCCDGFLEGYPFRVQTHFHDDHMMDFDTSKGFQDIFMSPETYELLAANFNADILYRENLRRLQRGETCELEDGSKLRLLSSNHVLGSCQVELILKDGTRLGYSGDFGWPLDEVIQVDQLVIDSTYGNPTRSIREYTQDDAEECLLSLVLERLHFGNVYIKAHRGTIERVAHILSGRIQVPILATDRLIREVEVYQKFSSISAGITPLDSDDGKHALQERSYVRLFSKGDRFANEHTEAQTTIECSAFMVRGDEPMIKRTDRSYSVALTNHADFNETIQYVEATGAEIVVTDNTRNYALDLARAINERFSGVHAMGSTNKPGPRWNSR